MKKIRLSFLVTFFAFLPQSLEETVTNNEDCNHTFQPNGMPNYKQCDPEWKCFPYAGHPELSSCTESVCTDEAMNNNICISGCGIVTSAMLLNFYGFKELIPTGILKLLNFMKISCTYLT